MRLGGGPPAPPTARLSAVNRRPDSGYGRPLPAPSLPLSASPPNPDPDHHLTQLAWFSHIANPAGHHHQPNHTPSTSITLCVDLKLLSQCTNNTIFIIPPQTNPIQGQNKHSTWISLFQCRQHLYCVRKSNNWAQDLCVYMGEFTHASSERPQFLT